MPAVSIIIPVYNTEKYLSKCLDSVLTQTFADFECLLIENGSSDGSGRICDEYAVNDKRIKVVHQEGRGVSFARNTGLDMASGKWIVFVDSDDWIEPTLLSSALSIAQSQPADIVQWNYISEGGKKVKKTQRLQPGEFVISPEKELPGWFSMVWSRMYSKAFLEENNIRFNDELFFGEDGLFSVQALFSAKSIWNTDKALYHYIDRTDSVINTMDIMAVENKILAAKKIEEFLKQRGQEKRFDKVILQKKRGARDSLLFNLPTPDIKGWRKTFPEINLSLLNIREKKAILYLTLFIHLDWAAKLLIKLYIGYFKK